MDGEIISVTSKVVVGKGKGGQHELGPFLILVEDIGDWAMSLYLSVGKPSNTS